MALDRGGGEDLVLNRPSSRVFGRRRSLNTRGRRQKENQGSPEAWGKSSGFTARTMSGRLACERKA